MSIRSTSIRFNLDKPPDREAWENLQGMDKRKYKSYSNVVALAVNEFFERRRKLKSDPYLETREREEQFVQQILSELEKALEKELPRFMISFFSSITKPYSVSVQTEQPQITHNDEDIDWDFISGDS